MLEYIIPETDALGMWLPKQSTQIETSMSFRLSSRYLLAEAVTTTIALISTIWWLNAVSQSARQGYNVLHVASVIIAVTTILQILRYALAVDTIDASIPRYRRWYHRIPILEREIGGSQGY